jgi:hypothetical protein
MCPIARSESRRYDHEQPPDQNVDLRNVTVGVGGATLFVTEAVGNPPLSGIKVVSGIAYRC